MEKLSIFDILPAEEAEKYRPKKSNDWKWSFADYPKEKSGLKVFSCFDCGYSGPGDMVRHGAQVKWNKEVCDGRS